MRWNRPSSRATTIRDAARQALDDGRLDEARDGFRQAIDLGVNDGATWFNLGLVEKLSRNWQASADSNRRAAELEADNVEAHWNLGVAATALRDWETARWAWQRLGFGVGESGPPAADFGPAPVRLNPTPEGGGEVVWGRRIDPCRVRLESVPLPESGHRFSDVVLHDVVPRGERPLGERVVPVFDELIRMEPSTVPTFEVDVSAPTQGDVTALVGAFADDGFGAEDWSAIRFVCASCSLAGAHRHDAENNAVGWEPDRKVGLAAPREVIERLLGAWSRGAPGRLAGDLRLVG